ncbi:MAG: type I methionyl aminopeptidase [Chloroflexi bacterium]|nr:type I methionyl aminopeptidase [Chloroflexota bacterium]
MITIKSSAELEKMWRAGTIVAATLRAVAYAVRPGVTTAELDRIAFETIRAAGGRPSFKGYCPNPNAPAYPATICASVNDELVHGIPGKRALADGDIISIDVGAIWQGYHADAAITVPAGDVPPETRRLLVVTQEALRAGIGAARAGSRLGDISAAIQQVIEGAGYSVSGGGYGGHGVGRKLHEDPHVSNQGTPGRGPLLRAGMTLALEPMVNAGGEATVVRPDKWTVASADGMLCAHFEHTIGVTSGEPEILTELAPDVYERIGVPPLRLGAGVRG